MPRFKVELIREECTACESCVGSCPDHWEMEDDGQHSHLKGSTTVGGNEVLEMDTLGCNKEAAEGCPVNCIHIYESANKII
jgi:ferredoxin